MPGPISSREDLDEAYFSAATLIAYLSRENFDGFITYDDSTGLPITGLDVELFATGQRNSYDICLHSNGNLYATGTVMICSLAFASLFSDKTHLTLMYIPFLNDRQWTQRFQRQAIIEL